MKKNMRKILSLLLSIVITFQIIPQQVYALVLESTKEIQENSQNIDEYSGSKAFVEGEIEDLRTETEKHYKLSDGTFYSVSYFEPVHYVDSEGKWQDIDNTLFIDEEKKLYSTKQNGKSKVQFSTDLSDGELASLSWGDYLVSMSLLNASEIEEYLSEAELGNDPDYFELLRSFHTEYNPGSTIEIQDYETAPKDKAENEYNSGELIPKTLSSKVSYSEAYEGVDIEYTLRDMILRNGSY